MPDNDKRPPKVVYIAGPMTGLADFNYPAFQEAGFELALRGYEVLNPVQIENWNTLGRPQAWDWYMRHAIAMVLRAEGIALLPDWEKSRGARLERTIASELSLDVRDLEDWLVA